MLAGGKIRSMRRGAGLAVIFVILSARPMPHARAAPGDAPALETGAATALEARAAPGKTDIDSLAVVIDRLQSFRTRFSGTAASDSAARYLASKLQAMGLETRIDTVAYLSGSWKKTFNVVATVRGASTGPIVVLGAHYDSISRFSYTDSLARAPGADDNASGCAALMEAARILERYPLEHTVQCVFFGGEEVGRIGSSAFAADAAARGTRIKGMMSLDAIGYEPGPVRDVEIIHDAASDSLARACAEAFARFSSGTVAVTTFNSYWGQSDHYPFWREGYPAVHVFEGSRDENPYFHTDEDVASRIDIDYLRDITDTIVRFALELAGIAESGSPIELGAAFPNPFENVTAVPYFISSRAPVTVTVYDVKGRKVRRILSSAAVFDGTVHWDGADDSGEKVSSGVYFMAFDTRGHSRAVKVIFIR